MDYKKKIIDTISSMNKVAKMVIKYGVLAFFAVCIISLVLMLLNRYYLGDLTSLANNFKDMFRSSFSILGITVIGGIVMDFVAKNQSA